MREKQFRDCIQKVYYLKGLEDVVSFRDFPTENGFTTRMWYSSLNHDETRCDSRSALIEYAYQLAKQEGLIATGSRQAMRYNLVDADGHAIYEDPHPRFNPEDLSAIARVFIMLKVASAREYAANNRRNNGLVSYADRCSDLLEVLRAVSDHYHLNASQENLKDICRLAADELIDSQILAMVNSRQYQAGKLFSSCRDYIEWEVTRIQQKYGLDLHKCATRHDSCMATLADWCRVV